MGLTLDVQLTWTDGTETQTSYSVPNHLIPRLHDHLAVPIDGGYAIGKVVAVGWALDDPSTVRIGLVDVDADA